MQELRHRIEERNQSAGDPWEQVFLSCGMAVYQPGQDLQAEQVVNRADEAMYEDKRHQKERAENGSEK
jgi:PleD family two-component response regulator